MHRKRKAHQRSSVVNYQHHDINLKEEKHIVNKVALNGGIFIQRSKDNLGEEDEIDCLIDDNISDDGHDVRNGDDGTLLRSSFGDNVMKNKYQPRYCNEDNVNKSSKFEMGNVDRNTNATFESTLRREDNIENDFSDGTLQNNIAVTTKGEKKDKNDEPSQIPRVQRILEKGKANLSRSKSELGEQHRKVLSQLTKGKSGITEQNKRLLANITSGMDKGKRFVMPGFSFGATNNEKTKESLNDSGCNEVDDEMPTSLEKIKNGIEDNDIEGGHRTEIPTTDSQNTTDGSNCNGFESYAKSGENINRDLDRMLTNLGIQISAAEAATTESVGQSQSKSAVSSLMTQSVYVTPSNSVSSIQNSSKNMFSAKTLIVPSSYDRRVLSGNNLLSPCNSQLPNKIDPNTKYTPISPTVRPNFSSKNLKPFQKDKEVKKTFDAVTEADRLHKDLPLDNVNITQRNYEAEENDDYLLLERSLENDYGEFDFIDGDATLNRSSESPPSSYKHIAEISKKYGEISQAAESHNKQALSLYDEVFEEIDKQKHDTVNCKESRFNQKNTKIIKEHRLRNDIPYIEHSTKKTRRLSSSSLSSAPVCDSSISGIKGNVKYAEYMGSQASFRHSVSPTKNTSVFMPSSAKDIANVSVYADHTLMLRSNHKRRRRLLMKHANFPTDPNEKVNINRNQIQCLEKISTNSPNLRRCTSLAQNVYSESSSDCSPFFCGESKMSGNVFVNNMKEDDDKDQVSQKLLFLNGDCTDSGNYASVIDNTNNNSAKNDFNTVSWLSKSISTSVTNERSFIEKSFEPKFYPHPRVKYCAPDEDKTTKDTTNNNANNKSIHQQKNRRSPWLLRSNLSSFVRRKRGSSTSLHTISLNDDESYEFGQSSSIHPAMISQNGASYYNIAQNGIVLYANNSKTVRDKENENKFIERDASASLADSKIPSDAEQSMSLNRR